MTLTLTREPAVTDGDDLTVRPAKARRRIAAAVIAGAIVAPLLATGLAGSAQAAPTANGAAVVHQVAKKAVAKKVAKKATKKAVKKVAAKKAVKKVVKKAPAKAAAKPVVKVSAPQPAVSSVAPALFDNNAYPYKNAAATGGDSLNMGVRQCTSYAAWALTRLGVALTADPVGGADLTGPRGTARLGDAKTWANAANAAGYTVSSTPVVGAIAQWNADETSRWSANGSQPGGWLTAGDEGHVGVVVAVNSDGSAVIRDYNGWVSVGFAEHRETAPRYLYIGVN